LAARNGLAPLREGVAQTRAEPRGTEASDLIPVSPAPATMSRRALLGTVGAGSLFLLLQGLGDTVGGPLRRLSLFGPRSLRSGGPDGFPINRTAEVAAITSEKVGTAWRLRLRAGGQSMSLSRAQLLRMPQHVHDLPIACVEGWSTTQRWSGIRIVDMARLVGVEGPFQVATQSIASNGVFDAATLSPAQTSDERTLLALRVNGADLSLDHGFPARVIGPGIPGVHCTKWVATLTFARV
ncbi:MAG: molybdopterin-dependent oxidoreductase, partial [Actinomycetota bacterium]|nr:molybdopterin-dependent oxidoreductase [Actinomycetota bacterium]